MPGILWGGEPEQNILVYWGIKRGLMLLALIAMVFFSSGLPALSFLPFSLIYAAMVTAYAASMVLSFFSRKTYRYYIDTKGVNVEKGLLNRTTKSLPFKKINNVVESQNIFQKFLGIYTIKIKPSQGITHLSFEGIRDPDVPRFMIMRKITAGEE